MTLCGSTKFEKEYHYWNEHLTLQGHIVISLSVFPSNKPTRKWYSEETKKQLDYIHLYKISISDAIFVIDCSLHNEAKTYIGESTKREIEFAKAIGKSIKYASNMWSD